MISGFVVSMDLLNEVSGGGFEDLRRVFSLTVLLGFGHIDRFGG